MGRLKKMQDKVEHILETYPNTRDNDRMLIGAIYAIYYDVDINNETFASVLANEMLPNFETIRRCRQKAQEENITLRGHRDKERIARQEEFIEYALSDRSGDRI